MQHCHIPLPPKVGIRFIFCEFSTSPDFPLLHSPPISLKSLRHFCLCWDSTHFDVQFLVMNTNYLLKKIVITGQKNARETQDSLNPKNNAKKSLIMV